MKYSHCRKLLIVTCFVICILKLETQLLATEKNVTSMSFSTDPKLYEDGAGKIIGIYLARAEGGVIVVKGSIWDANSGWSTPQVLSTQTRVAANPTMTINKNTGKGLVVFSAFDTSLGINFVESVEYDTKRGFGETEIVSDCAEDASFGDHRVILDDKDHKVVLWSICSDLKNRVIRSNEGTFGGAWFGVHQLSE